MAAAPCPPWVLLGRPHNRRTGTGLPRPRCEVGAQETGSRKVSRGPASSEVPGLGRPPRLLCPAGSGDVFPAGPRQDNAPCVRPRRGPATLPTGRKRRRGHDLRGAPPPGTRTLSPSRPPALAHSGRWGTAAGTAPPLNHRGAAKGEPERSPPRWGGWGGLPWGL